VTIGPIHTDKNMAVKIKEIEIILTYEDIACILILASKMPKFSKGDKEKSQENLA